MAVQGVRALDHGGSDIDAVDSIEALGQRLREAADTAAEVERAATELLPAGRLGGRAQHEIDLRAPGLEELPDVPPAVLLVR